MFFRLSKDHAAYVGIYYLSRMQKKLFLLDAFALIFRAYYALIRNPRITSTGRLFITPPSTSK